MLENFSVTIKLGFPLPGISQSNDLALSMPVKSRLGRFKIALSASFGEVRRAPLIQKAAIRSTLFRGVRMDCKYTKMPFD